MSYEEVLISGSRFQDAIDAGTENACMCTLILADGDVAAKISLAGLNILGRQRYGMFKLSNFTQEAKLENMQHPEIVTLILILGLQYNTDYSDQTQRNRLRYGTVLMLTHQNLDGLNFKGLFINFIYKNWPHLLHTPFLEYFKTPVIKATSKANEAMSNVNECNKYLFFSLAEFDAWKETVNINSFDIKQYPSLGANDLKEVTEYFSHMHSHSVRFYYDKDGSDDENIIKTFDESAIEQRREWLIHHMIESKRHKSRETSGIRNSLTFSEFINSEYVFFAASENVRSIPSIFDGFTLIQRKVLFTCIKRDDKCPVTVKQLAYSVTEEAAYYQEEQSICKIIYNLARDSVGSNNINLLIPSIQFGTLLMGDKDDDEYHCTHIAMSPLIRLIFHPLDDPLLIHNFNENQKIEPKTYIPIIPMILVNGYKGTGSAWSTDIPKFSPLQLIGCLRNMIAGKELFGFPKPFYRRFRGSIRAMGRSTFVMAGRAAVIGEDIVEITQLPIGISTACYKKNVLDHLLKGSETSKPIIIHYEEHHTDTTVRFIVSFVRGELNKLQRVDDFYDIFQLYGIIEYDNMNAFDSETSIRNYKTAYEILKEFYNYRIESYVARKEYWVKRLVAEADTLINQAKFVQAKISNALNVENKTPQTIVGELIALGYQDDPLQIWKQHVGIEPSDTEWVELNRLSRDDRRVIKKFDYLLNMPMWMLTKEKKNQLFNRRDAKIFELNTLRAKSVYDLWLSDLEKLEEKLVEMEDEERTNADHRECSFASTEITFRMSDFFVKYCKEERRKKALHYS